MSIRQDRLTFFGVLVAVVIAVVGYLQLGTMYPLEGRADPPASRGDEAEKNHDPSGSDAALRPEDAAP